MSDNSNNPYKKILNQLNNNPYKKTLVQKDYIDFMLTINQVLEKILGKIELLKKKKNAHNNVEINNKISKLVDIASILQMLGLNHVIPQSIVTATGKQSTVSADCMQACHSMMDISYLKITGLYTQAMLDSQLEESASKELAFNRSCDDVQIQTDAIVDNQKNTDTVQAAYSKTKLEQEQQEQAIEFSGEVIVKQAIKMFINALVSTTDSDMLGHTNVFSKFIAMICRVFGSNYRTQTQVNIGKCMNSFLLPPVSKPNATAMSSHNVQGFIPIELTSPSVSCVL